MKVPTISQAEYYLSEAEKLYPGKWVIHNRVAGDCAKTIAENCNDMDPDIA